MQGGLKEETSTQASEYFSSARNAFDRAVRRDGQTKFQFVAAESIPITLEFAGSVLFRQLTAALSHLEGSLPQQGGLTVRVFGGDSPDDAFPTSPWAEGSYESDGRVFAYTDGRVLYSDGRFRMYFYLGEEIILVDFERGEAICWYRDAPRLPYYERGAPLRTVLQWWVERTGLSFVHGAAVGFDDGGILLAGKGGSGKSTTALLCLNSELRYASDDYCLLNSGEARVHSLYNTAKVESDNVARVPHVADYIENSDRLDEEKALLFIYRHRPDKIITSFPVRALALPSVVGTASSRFTPASQADGLRGLAPSTIFQLAGAGSATFRRLSQFVRAVPVYNLELGSDLAEIPRTIQRFLEEMNQ